MSELTVDFPLILVCLGSTAFTMASFAFTTTTGDSGRVAAQIVTGIGFLGAGAILHGSGIVRGMTTAARMPRMITTIKSSTSVNALRFMVTTSGSECPVGRACRHEPCRSFFLEFS